MDWSKFAEEKIAEAMASGELQPLEGLGRPLDMEAYFAPRDEDRIASHVLKTSGHVPEEISLLHDIARVRAQLEKETRPEEHRALRMRLMQLETDWNMKMERRRSRNP